MLLRIMLFGPGLTLLPILFIAPSLLAQQKNVDLFRLAQTGGLAVENRTIAPLTDGGRKGIRFSAAEGDGVAWIKGIGFSNGSIELDIRGKDVLQQSFVGVAFHAINEDSLESIYFRPFNFRSTDSVRKTHAVQYIDQPDFPWEKLRRERTGIFEKAINPPPTADQWFHVRITVHYPGIKVYVNNNTSPSLTVKELSSLTDGRIGLWVGNNSDGDFANLVIDDH